MYLFEFLLTCPPIFKILSRITDFLFGQFFLFFVKKTIFEENYFQFKNIPSPIFRYVNIQTVYFPHKENEKNL